MLQTIMSNSVSTKQRRGASYFLHPTTPTHRQYEALRAYLVDGLPANEVAQRFGYCPATLYSLSRELRAGRLLFFSPHKPGPKHAPKLDAVRSRVIELRKLNYSVYDIQRILRHEGSSVSHVLIHRILTQEGFAKLPRRRDDERPTVPRPLTVDTADIRRLDWRSLRSFETEAGGLFVFIPFLAAWGVEQWVRHAKLPGSVMIPPLQSFLSMLALKLTGKERLSHVMDVCADPGFALFAALNALPKTTALSTYSYRVTRAMTATLLEHYTQTMHHLGLLHGDSFNLDFHAIPHRGHEAVLEKHYVSKRSRRERAVLAFLVQDGSSRVLCYANATVDKDHAAEEILEFVQFWKEQHGTVPPHLVFDSQLTTYDVLARLDKDGILFTTLRRRGGQLVSALDQLPLSAWKPMHLKGVSRRYQNPRFVETSITVRPLPRPLRQIAVRGLGHDEPTLFLTNEFTTKPAVLVERYAKRMLIENSIAQNVDFFHLDALSSAIAIQVDFDVMLTLIANALYRTLAQRLKGFQTAQPKQIFRRFLNTPARVQVSDNTVHVRIRRCTHHPILLASGALDLHPEVPWWQARRLHIEIR